MPRSFLVKCRKQPAGYCRWGEHLDEMNGGIYIPDFVLNYVTENNLRNRSRNGDPVGDSPESGSSDSSLCRENLNNPNNADLCEDDLSPEETDSSEDDAEGQPLDLRTPSVLSRIKVTTGSLGEEIYSCYLCGKGFRFQRTLNHHIKSHYLFERKRRRCTICGKRFIDICDLERHLRTHTGFQPYRCDFCNTAFIHRYSLESHKKKVHGVQQAYPHKQKRYKLCEECSFMGPSQQSLFFHVCNTHPNSDFLNKTAKKLVELLETRILFRASRMPQST